MQKLKAIIARQFSNFGASKNEDKQSFDFEPLTPISNLTENNGYLRALDFAISEKSIFNIAVSGPYGSGKSSIISSYQKSRNTTFLNISLATFGSLTKGDVETRQIEKGILQQLLYGTKSGELPQSRFKRIDVPKYILPKSIAIILWVFAVYYCFTNRAALTDLSYFAEIEFSFSEWKFLPLILLVVGAIEIVRRALHAFANNRLKRFSFTGVEIEETSPENESILSAHLDEVIYFFRTTNTNVVVFEDLDRFNNSEVFYKLREINKLVNDGSGRAEKVKFIYAIKDDRFNLEDRTKFFDFLIPVIPIINSTNSIDKFRERLEKCGLLDQVEDQLLRDVSLHLYDFRLINNIVNEFQLYLNRLPEQGLDHTKLLAMMVYKNVYAQDFEWLHHRTGIVFEVCEKRSQFEDQVAAINHEEIKETRATIKSASEELIETISELRTVYLAQIILKAAGRQHQGISGFRVQNQDIPINQLADEENFEKLMSAAGSLVKYAPNSGHINCGFSFSDIEKEINSKRSFTVRRRDIELRTSKKRSKLEAQIEEAKLRISSVDIMPLKDLLEKNQNLFEGCFQPLGAGAQEAASEIDFALLKTLLLEGYIDENYSDFTSNFHEGRLSQNDILFLKTVRSRNATDRSIVLHNPVEVCLGMRQTDFEQKYVLNFSLVDFLLNDDQANLNNKSKAIKYIANNFEQSDEFLSEYYEKGKSPEKLVRALAGQWAGVDEKVIGSPNSLRHFANLISHVDFDLITRKLNPDGEFSHFIEMFGPELEGRLSNSKKHFPLYRDLKVQFSELTSLAQTADLLEFAISESLYEISPDNICLVLEKSLSYGEEIAEQVRSQNYSVVLASECVELQNYVSANISEYIENVMLSLEQNVKETAETIKLILNNDDIELSRKQAVAIKQEHVFADFDGIPEELFAFLLGKGKVSVTWENLSRYQKSEHFDEETLSSLLDEANNVDILAKHNIWDGGLDKDDASQIAQFVVSRNEINDKNYGLLLEAFNRAYIKFPDDVSREKQLLLVKQGVVSLSEKTHEAASGDVALMTSLILGNEKKFFSDFDEFPVNDDVFEELLSSSIAEGNKLKIIESISSEFVTSTPKAAKIIASLIDELNLDIKNVELLIIRAAIANAGDVERSIRIFVENAKVSNATEIAELAGNLPTPFHNVLNVDDIPRTASSLKLVKTLKSKKLISSYKSSGKKIEIHRSAVDES